MKCANDGTLRSLADGELSASERKAVIEHVAGCETCSAKVIKVRNSAQQVQSWMAGLGGEDIDMDVRAAYSRYQMAVEDRAASRWNRWLLWLRTPQFSAAASAVAIILLLSFFAPAQVWAQHFLQLLRIQKLAVVPIDSSAFTHAGLPDGASRALAQMISDDVVVTIKPNAPTAVSDVATAQARVGFNVEALDALGAPQHINVEDEGAFHMTLDVDRIRGVLEEAGRTDIQVPSSVNGSTVAVAVAKGVTMLYGNCGDGKGKPSEGNCISFLQIPSPKVSVPPDLNMQALAEAGMQLAGVSSNEASTFAKNVDWTSTLVIPVPLEASYRTVAVDGVNGMLIEMAAKGAYRGSYDLIWIKDGVVHAVNGRGNSSQVLAAVANLGS